MRLSALQKLGLSQNESRVYLALLHMKSGTAVRIAERADIAKSTVYDTLKELAQRGLVNIYKKRGRKHFSPNDPRVLQENLAAQGLALTQALPGLQALFGRGAIGSKTDLYTGREGVERVVNEILSEADELLGVGSPEELFAHLPEFFPWFTQARKERNIPLRAIFRDSPKARERRKTDMDDLRESRLVKPDVPFSGFMYMWKDKIAMLTFTDEVVVVVIENRELHIMLRALFELLWNQAT